MYLQASQVPKYKEHSNLINTRFLPQSCEYSYIANIIITLFAAPEDYTEVSIELILSPASEKSCATISTIDDAIVENTETLKMSLACAEPSVTIFSLQGRVEISDNDSKLNC